MSMKIILLIIAFQVVMGVLAKRKARKAAEGAQGAGGAGRDSADRRPGMGESAYLPGPARKPEAIRGSRGSYDEDEGAEDGETEDEWEEHTRTPGGIRADKGAPGLGKDLLSQLARELGLELPAPAQRTPAPPSRTRPAQPAAKAPAAPASPSQAPAPRRTTLSQRMEEAKRTAPAHASRAHYRDAGESAPRRAPSNAPDTQEASPRPLSELARESLADAGSIRRAFILKTILDKPLSLQPRLPGRI